MLGKNVICNGFQGTIVEVCTGQLDGMVVVRLDSGKVCVPVSEVTPEWVKRQRQWKNG